MSTSAADDDEFIGYEPAGDYVGLSKSTMSFYCLRGTGPKIDRRIVDRGYYRPVFKKAELDRWMSNRLGRGFRSDLAHAGRGNVCEPCGDRHCTIDD